MPLMLVDVGQRRPLIAEMNELGLVDDPEAAHRVGGVEQHVGIGRRGLVERLEGGADRVAVVLEVEYVDLVLAGGRTVQPRQGLHRVDAREDLVDVHAADLRLVEARLVLLGDDEDAVDGLVVLDGAG